MTLNTMQYAKRKCGHHTPNMMACGACDKCLDCCECSKGNIELFEALARNKLNRAQKDMLEKMYASRPDVPRKRIVPTTDVGEQGRTRAKKKFCLGRDKTS